MGQATITKNLYLKDGKFVLEESFPPSQIGGNVRRPNIKVWKDRMRVECLTITREAFVSLSEQWRDFIDEPDNGREL